MIRKTQEMSLSRASLKWLITSCGGALLTSCFGLIGAIAIMIITGGRITGFNVGPVQVDVEPLQAQENSSAAQNLAQDLPDNNQVFDQGIEAQPISNPASTSCPYDPQAFLLYYEQITYEPSLSGQAIIYSYDGFAVWDPNYYGYALGDYILFPYPPANVDKNVWQPLLQTGFEVCVDNNLNVYARFG